MITIIVCAVVVIASTAWSAYQLVRLHRDMAGRGEVADVPSFDEHAIQALDMLSTWQTCQLNDRPHWCFQPPRLTQAEGDQLMCAAMEWQFPKIKDRRIR